MNKCPNPAYGDIECPFALPKNPNLPCFGSDESCAEWRQKLEERKDDPFSDDTPL